MTKTTVELIAEALFEDTRQGHPDCMTWAEMKAHHGPEYEGVARFYSRANAALNALRDAGFVIMKITARENEPFVLNDKDREDAGF